MIEMEILYEDASLLVCVKPAGLISEEAGVPALLREQTGAERILPVHRLDKEAAGLMLCAKTQEAAAELSGQITEGRFQKEYLAVAEGCAEEGGALYDLLFHERTKNKTYVVSRARRGVKQALLHYERLAYCEGLSLLRVRLETGRTHQIRVQFASRGLPLVGDGKYGAQNRRCPLALFSCALSFRHPKTGEALRFDALPEEAWPWTLFSEALRSSAE